MVIQPYVALNISHQTIRMGKDGLEYADRVRGGGGDGDVFLGEHCGDVKVKI